MTPKDLFEILAREHASMLTVYLRSVIRDPAAVDDLFQETMLTAWKTLDRFDRSRPFGPWLRGIAAKNVLAYRRKQARGAVLCDAQLLEALDHRLDQVSRQPGDTLDEKLDGLRRCLDALPEQYRQPVQWRYESEIPSETIAQRLDITVEALKKRLQRGRARLLDCLDRKLAEAEASG